MMSGRSGFVLLFFLSLLISLVTGQSDTTVISGKASFYHDKFHGRQTSSGEEHDMNDFTAAHRTLPFGTLVHVTNKQNGKSVVVKINDRGPFYKSRIIDLTRAAAMKLGMVPFGVVPVKLQVLTLLNQLTASDSTLHENELWDCYGNKGELTGNSIFLWRTNSMKHAFYMASDILLGYHLEKVFVKVTGSENRRSYEVVVSGLEDDRSAELLRTAKKEGFRFARQLKP